MGADYPDAAESLFVTSRDASLASAQERDPAEVSSAGPHLRFYDPGLRDVAARFTITRARDDRIRGVHADTASGTRQLTVRHRRRPVAGTWRDVRYAHA